MEWYFNIKKFRKDRDKEQRVVSLKKRELATFYWHLKRNNIQYFFISEVLSVIKHVIHLSSLDDAS